MNAANKRWSSANEYGEPRLSGGGEVLLAEASEGSLRGFIPPIGFLVRL